jgi:ribosomal protein S18 acetylase RimI-like enzyme
MIRFLGRFVRIRRLLTTDWEAFRTLRLQALRADPLAFGSTLSREIAYPKDRWRKWDESGALGDESATFVVEAADGRLLGMAGLFTDRDAYHIWGMWVSPEARGQGLGRDLLNRVLSWATSTNPKRRIRLDVNPSQRVAVRLYESRGFRPTGKTTPLGHDPPAFVQEMAREPTGALASKIRRTPDLR